MLIEVFYLNIFLNNLYKVFYKFQIFSFKKFSPIRRFVREHAERRTRRTSNTVTLPERGTCQQVNPPKTKRDERTKDLERFGMAWNDPERFGKIRNDSERFRIQFAVGFRILFTFFIRFRSQVPLDPGTPLGQVEPRRREFWK